MKTTKLIILTMALGLMGVGCAKTSSQSAPVVPPGATVPGPIIIDPTAPGVGSTGSPIFSSGATATFVPVNLQTMSEYVATHPLNAPTNFKINMNLAQAESGKYGGSVSISYFDNGIQYDGVFQSGMGRNQTFKGMYDNGELESKYNYWFNFENKLVFSGFFEDQYGAITVVLEPETTAASTGGNDGEPIALSYRGTVYFKNFMVQSNPYVGGNTTGTTAQHSPYRACWFTYMGPYDCRSNVVQTKCGLNPTVDAGYKKLGTFTGLSTKAAFNIQ
ncbi:MAG: hypothetical protein A2622_00585 [Bdellovibrionales bacterium RIFCSPHIGHO2_01_FULL_40_29]|nr:MAG: hypothetical protein A2622_00585 [Bdellovibrionales bacterium RIFCSPHIGHO2_01_FULL_40_29]